MHTYQVKLTNKADATLSLAYAKTHQVTEQSEGPRYAQFPIPFSLMTNHCRGTVGGGGPQPTSSTAPSIGAGIIAGPTVAVVVVIFLVVYLILYVRPKPRGEKVETQSPGTPIGTISPYLPHIISSRALPSSPVRTGGKSRQLSAFTPAPHGSNLSLPLPATQPNMQTSTSQSFRRDQPPEIERIVELVTQRIVRWSPPSPSVPAIPPPQYTR